MAHRMDREAGDQLTNGRLGLGRFWPLIALGLFAAAMAVLHRELAATTLRHIVESAKKIPPSHLGRAVTFTALAYAVLPGYDAIALSYARHPLPLSRTAFGSFIAYSFSQTLGFPLFSGGSIRYRLWSSWGLTTAEIARGVGFVAFSFTLGMVAISGVVFLLEPRDTAGLLGLPPGSLRPLGALNLTLVAGYVAWCALRRRPIILRGQSIPVPSPALAGFQLLVAALDWSLAGSVLYALLPAGHGLAFLPFLGVFLIAQVAGLVSHVPGGLGVFESVLVLLLRPYLPASALLGSLVVYRAVYYLLPFGVGIALLGGYELRQYGPRAAGVARALGGWMPRLLPQVLAGAVFLTGAILLLSGATPPERGRIAWLGELLPLGVIELSHFVGSIAGVGLLVLAWGLWRRLDAAYGLTVGLLVVGIAASLLKGGDWEEALALGVVLCALLPSREHFYRRAALVAEPIGLEWVVAILAVLGASVWLGLFAHKHVEYRDELWWRFALDADAPRFLRASVGAVGVLLSVGLLRLLRHAPAVVAPPSEAAIDRAAALVATAVDASAHLALVGDKTLLFSESTRGLLMYGISGRSWVALGDPLGDTDDRRELAWRFRELADRHGGWTVFYEVGVHQLPLYIDLGLTFLKLGEQARIPLEQFSLEGGDRKTLRRTLRAIEKDGGSFQIIPPKDVPPILPTLRAISDGWLMEKHTREKGFSLGLFDERYVSRCPVAVVRRQGEIVAFANVWATSLKEELSIDLMRHSAAAPQGTMDYLFTELILWGRSQGYRYFDLGMAPLSGLESHTLAPLWNRLGAFMYRHGEHFYNFQGVREYKEKFDPVWEPRYLASPGGLALPRIMTNVASLIGGGFAGILSK